MEDKDAPALTLAATLEQGSADAEPLVPALLALWVDDAFPGVAFPVEAFPVDAFPVPADETLFPAVAL
jgi:hypothetical protein